VQVAAEEDSLKPGGKHMQTQVKTPKVIRTIAEFRQWRQSVTEKVGLVPTMGALHEGHIALIQKAESLCDRVVVWIFVNPLQFGPNEDFDAYPRTFENDLEVCRANGVDTVFAPTEKEIYPEGKDKCIKVFPPSEIADVCEGSYRPGYFVGIATVVAKFFNIVQPNIAVLGEKDYQQLVILKKLVTDLNMPLSIEPVAIVREPDGLAKSSRNVYLSPEERQVAPKVFESLRTIAQTFKQNGSDVESALTKGKEVLDKEPRFEILFLEARDAVTFLPYPESKNGLIVVISVQLGKVRLIDNIRIS
jgi:pantoate--beta-alanine ligase